METPDFWVSLFVSYIVGAKHSVNFIYMFNNLVLIASPLHGVYFLSMVKKDWIQWIY